MLKGIDVADPQGNVNWAKARADGVRWAGTKATEGQDWTSKTFNGTRVRAIRKAGIEFTPYHYLRFRRDRTGDVEARHCLEVCLDAGWRPGEDMPITVDTEWISNGIELRAMSGAQAREYVSDFAEFLAKTKRAGKRGCIDYLSPSFAPELGSHAPRAAGLSWVAAWDAVDGHPPTPAGFRRSLVRFHQISDKGHRSYVESGVVDLDVFMGTVKDLQAIIRGRQPKPPKPVPAPSQGDVLSVRQQQALLKQIGWPLKVDGVRGPMTKGALLDFQLGMAKSPRRLVRDGVCGPLTARWLRWSADHGGRASDHFTFREFASSHAPHWIKVERDLIIALEKLRIKFGRPIGVLSGYRDFALGASKSQHRYGNAMDPTLPLGTVASVRGLGFSGIGFNPRTGQVRHLDTRHRGPNFTGGTPNNPTVFADAF